MRRVEIAVCKGVGKERKVRDVPRIYACRSGVEGGYPGQRVEVGVVAMREGAQLERRRRERVSAIARAVALSGFGTRPERDGGMRLQENA